MGRPDLDLDGLPPAFRRHLTETELWKTSVLHSFDAIRPQLKRLEENQDSIKTILDVGCNRGGLVTALGDHLDADTVYGIDVDESCREQAAEKGVTVFDLDVESDSFPLEENSIDLVVSFGLLEHLRYYDTLFSEINRVSRAGWFWVATPNLASWINRFALLTGHQPRNVELSARKPVGILPVYGADDKFLNHVHAPTHKALLELLEAYGFRPLHSVALSPYQRSRLVRVIDGIFARRVSWARRVGVLSKQQ